MSALTVPQAAAPQTLLSSPASASRAVLDQYCVTCHNQRLKTAGLSLEGLDAAQAGSHPEVWEKVVRKLQARAMPPQGARRPDEATYQRLQSALEAQLDAEAAAHPNPGGPILHRLNRSEYANAVRDLLDLDVDVTSLLPPDDSAYGFDNIADVLGVSPSLQEHYLSAAVKIAALAVGDPDISAGSDTFRIHQDLSQDPHIDGLPLGTIGGTAVRYTFPLDGDYVFQVEAVSHQPERVRGPRGSASGRGHARRRARFSATIGGRDDLESLFDKPTDTSDAVDARLRVRVPVTAGPHDVSVAFVEDRRWPNRCACSRFCAARSTTSTGRDGRTFRRSRSPVPFNATGPGDTPSRRRIFVCRPTPRRRARRAVRAPDHRDAGAPRVSAVAEVDASTDLLASPKFVFRVERDPPNVAPGAPYRISDVELASRLSFFLWSSIPDDELLRVAAGAG